MARLLICALVVWALRAEAVETVRILIGESREDVTVQADGLGYREDTEDTPDIRWSPAPKTMRVHALAGGALELEGVRSPLRAVRFHAAGAGDDLRRATLHAAQWHVGGELVVRVAEGRLQLINVISLEEYLAGVLGAEMPPRFPSEALKAQAVAARTYALHKKIEAYGAPYHLGSSVLDQVYQGLRSADSRTRAAVEATRGEVLTFSLEPIEAYFHASCGGKTESGREALQRDLPYLQPVDCPCGTLGQSKWALTLSPHDLGVLDARAGVQVSSRSPSGRVRSLQLGRRTLDAVSFRRQLGYERVKSLDFEVEAKAHSVQLHGKGYGHGAGLCQLGARVLAERGWSFEKILAHYYPGTELQALY